MGQWCYWTVDYFKKKVLQVSEEDEDFSKIYGDEIAVYFAEVLVFLGHL